MANTVEFYFEYLKDDVPYNPDTITAAAQLLDVNKTVVATLSAPVNQGTGLWQSVFDAETVIAGGLKINRLYYLRQRYTPLSGGTQQNKDVGFMVDPFMIMQERRADGTLYTPHRYSSTLITEASGTPGSFGTTILTMRTSPLSLGLGQYQDTFYLEARGFSPATAFTAVHRYTPFNGSTEQETGVTFVTPSQPNTILFDRAIWAPPMTAIGARGPRDGSSEIFVWESDESRFDSGASEVRARYERDLKMINLKFLDLSADRYKTWIRNWFRQQRGKEIPFLWKDWWDSGQETGVVVGTGTGAKVEFPLPHKYVDPTGVKKIYFDGVEQVALSHRIDAIDGKIIFTAAPASGKAITMDYVRYLLVRFRETTVTFTKTKETAYDVDVPLIEVLR